MDLKEYYFYLDIYYHTFQRHYAGSAASVLVTTEDGSRLQIPASYLRAHVTHVGIKGRFKIVLDENNAIISLEQVE